MPSAPADLARTETDRPGFVSQDVLPSHLLPIPTIVVRPPSPEVRISTVVVGTPVLVVPETAVVSSSASIVTAMDESASTFPAVAHEVAGSPAPAVDASVFDPADCSSVEMQVLLSSSFGTFYRAHRYSLPDEMRVAMGDDPHVGVALGEALEGLPTVQFPPPVHHVGL